MNSSCDSLLLIGTSGHWAKGIILFPSLFLTELDIMKNGFAEKETKF